MSVMAAVRPATYKPTVKNLLIGGPDAHSAATLAARKVVLQKRGEDEFRIVAKFPDTKPENLAATLASMQSELAAVRMEVIDVPVDANNPGAFIKALADFPASVKMYFDHHETTAPFAEDLARAGITPVIAPNGAAMASAMGMLSGSPEKELAIIGIVADRDPSALAIANRQEIEQKWLRLANILDIIVRQPSIVGASDVAGVAEWLSVNGVAGLELLNIDYPPERLARQVNVISEGTYTILYDAESVPPMWQPKTAEQVLLQRNKHYAVFIAPVINRQQQRIGYDVRALQYWLSELPEPADVLADLIKPYIEQGRAVGHGKYVSIRLVGAEKSDAMALARAIYQRLEGRLPRTAHLISDEIVAHAIREDYSRLYSLLERIATALERGAVAKEEQVSLLKEIRQREVLERD